jgi:hypothetical protein
MRKTPLLLLIPALLLMARVEADSMRCGNQLVRHGDSRSEVRAKCGEPVDVETRTILRRPYYNYNGRVLHFDDNSFVEIPVEVWTYNFGPYKLMRRVQFVDGRIDEIETLGYGYHDDSER